MEELPTSWVSLSQVIGFIISLSFCAFFSFLETTITALRLFKLKQLADSTQKYKALFQNLEKHPHRIIITILIVSSLANAISAALITRIMENIFSHLNLSEGLGFSIGIFFATSAILIFGEIIPKHIARYHGDSLLKSTLWITNLIFCSLFPLVRVLTQISDFITNKINENNNIENGTSEEEIQFLIDYTDQKGLMEPDKTTMLQNIFRIGKKAVKDIMIPKINIAYIDSNLNIKDALSIFSKYQFSRLPVIENSIDNIIGIVHQKDIFPLIQQNPEHKTIKDIVRTTLFVPESLKVNQLLRQFKQQQIHMAIVLDEYGSISGLVTLEDVLEEIVGEINDEHEVSPNKIISLKEGEWLIDAATSLESLENLFDITFERDEVYTLGGFLTEKLQELPKKGDKILYKKYSFQIQKADPKRVLQVLVSKN